MILYHNIIMETPAADQKAVYESLFYIAYFKGSRAGNALVNRFLHKQNPEGVPLKGEPSLQIPSISPRQSAVGDEDASMVTLARRMERATTLLASNEQGAEESTPVNIRERALG